MVPQFSDIKFSIETFDYSMHHCYEKVLQSIQESFEFKLTDSITWINLNGLNHVSDIEALGKHYELHPLVLEDIVNIAQRPKIDEYEDYLFIVLKMLYYDKDEIVVSEQVSFVLGDNYVLSFQEAEGDVFDSVRDRLRHAKGRIRGLGSDHLLYALIDALVDHYFIVNETMGNKVEDLEDLLFSGIIKDDLNKQVLQIKKELLKVRRVIFPLRDIINRRKILNTIVNINNLFIPTIIDRITK